MQADNWTGIVRLPKGVQRITDWLASRVRGFGSWINAHYRLRHAQSMGRGVRVHGRLELENRGGSLSVGNLVWFLGGPLRSQILCAPGAVLTIGDGCGFNYGFRIEANQEVRIGARCDVASLCHIIDRTPTRSGAIVIEDDVWLAHGVTVMPGVRIGKGSVVSAGTVVESDIPPGSLAIGRPARCIALSNLTH